MHFDLPFAFNPLVIHPAKSAIKKQKQAFDNEKKPSNLSLVMQPSRTLLVTTTPRKICSKKFVALAVLTEVIYRPTLRTTEKELNLGLPVFH